MTEGLQACGRRLPQALFHPKERNPGRLQFQTAENLGQTWNTRYPPDRVPALDKTETVERPARNPESR